MLRTEGEGAEPNAVLREDENAYIIPITTKWLHSPSPAAMPKGATNASDIDAGNGRFVVSWLNCNADRPDNSTGEQALAL